MSKGEDVCQSFFDSDTVDANASLPVVAAEVHSTTYEVIGAELVSERGLLCPPNNA